MSGAGTRLRYCVVNWTFLGSSGMRVFGHDRPPAGHGSTTCATRSSSAAILDAYRADLDVGARLPILSTYLGHVSPAATYWYLSAAPELLAAAGDRLERHLGGRP